MVPNFSELGDYQEAVGGYIDVVAVNSKLDATVHDEGIYDCQPNPMATLAIRGINPKSSTMLFGPVVFSGPPDREGYTTGIGDEELISLMNFIESVPEEGLEQVANAMKVWATNNFGRTWQ